MTAALATIVFLSAIWLVAAAMIETWQESGSKIAAALRGHSPLSVRAVQAPVAVRVTQRSFRQQPSLRAQPKLRAAA